MDAIKRLVVVMDCCSVRTSVLLGGGFWQHGHAVATTGLLGSGAGGGRSGGLLDELAGDASSLGREERVLQRRRGCRRDRWV
jgi:hypothetical protein